MLAEEGSDIEIGIQRYDRTSDMRDAIEKKRVGKQSCERTCDMRDGIQNKR